MQDSWGVLFRCKGKLIPGTSAATPNRETINATLGVGKAQSMEIEGASFNRKRKSTDPEGKTTILKIAR